MPFIRPEIAERLRDWREVLICIGVLLLGLWMTQQPGPVVKGVGLVAALAGAGLGFVAIRRKRFAAEDAAPGMVLLDEREVTYMGPIAGGSVDLDRLSVLRLRRQAGRKVWLLQTEDGNALAIPHGAEGETTLFDAFAALPGLHMPGLLAALDSSEDGSVIVWQRTLDPKGLRLTSGS
ncbi:hypothetical protein [Dinoroseobacter sp. S124A]|uniref:hypothetical protein n=1 Tax=Dinoroseobacter sp. S124A TaxID=3415128 RepID=UPI003C79C0CD